MDERDLWRLGQGSSDSTEGFATAVDHSLRLVSVNSGGVNRDVPWLGSAPWVGDRVRLVRSGQSWWCASVYGHPLGTVQSTGSSLATVLGDDGETYVYPYAFGASFSNGQRVALDHARRIVEFRLSTDPSGSAKETDSSAKTTTTERTFRPVDSANWFSTYSRWDSQFVDVSVSRSGYYFYGNQIASTIPDSASIISAKISIREVWDNLSGTAADMGYHSSATRPGSGPITLSGTAVQVNATGTYDITSWGDLFKTGSAKGVGFAVSTDWCRFDTYARSGAITVKWRA